MHEQRKEGKTGRGGGRRKGVLTISDYNEND
jgi:hypothetical protein